MGNSQGSILDTFGGEYEFDRWTVKLHNRRGTDRGVSIRYGKNLTSLEQDENCANVFTGVYPYWADMDGNLAQLPEKVVKLTGEYDEDLIMPLDLSQEFEAPPTEEQLRTRTEQYIADNDIGKPNVSWTVEFVQLEQTEEYKGKAILDQVLLGDTVSVVFPKLGVDVSARAVAARYKPSLGRYKNITLGKVKANIADTIVQQGQSIAKKPTASLVQSMIVTLTATILGAHGGAVRLLDTDGDGLQDTLYIGDSADLAAAKKVWRFNYEGWAASKDGYNGPFVFGATLDDGLLASSVTAANIVAGYIKSKDGKTIIDLDNGIVQLESADGSIKIDMLNNVVSVATVSSKGYPGKIELTANGIRGYGWDTEAEDYVMTLVISMGDNMGDSATATTINSWQADGGITIAPGKSGAAAFFGTPQSDTRIRGATIELGGKTATWHDNGDGTFSLIGT